MKQAMVVAKPGTDALAQEVDACLRKAGLTVVAQVEACDVLIAIGGDGTILNAARLALPHKKPVLGINAGRLGFLAGLEPHELDLLPRLAAREFELDSRMLLQVQVWQGEKLIAEEFCLNDAVVARQVTRAVEVQVDCGQGRVIGYLGDGVIFSTPTGSTAYNFSAGGPVVEPGIESIVLTPICNHKLFSRAIVFSQQTQFSLEIINGDLSITFDAQPPLKLEPGQRVIVQKAAQEATFIRLKPGSFLNILNAKMGGRI